MKVKVNQVRRTVPPPMLGASDFYQKATGDNVYKKDFTTFLCLTFDA